MIVLKRCSRCKQEKPQEDFNRRRSRKDGLQDRCRSCHKETQNAYYARTPSYQKRNKEKANQTRIEKRNYIYNVLAANSCVVCKETDIVVLTFDHIDPKTKTSEIGTMLTKGYALKRIQEEIDKCQIMCFNCHARKTAKDNNWAKIQFRKESNAPDGT